MGLAKPDIKGGKPFAEVIQEGESFILDGIRTVKANTAYGEGDMVVMNVRGHDEELTVWGAYLTAQAEAVEDSDLGRHYVIRRKVIQDFSKREVKALIPYDPETDQEIPF